ncbi:MAG: TRAP transporter small permease [Burkholderiales bacterium]|nr:MAG: TRAP transporter small permease [Betaproteobacteria bacterium]TAG24676.1 MAG: TRAP transporter small permease [Burkholderiales bacterium]TAG48330.1 MAG: TRAP transporter small permease [Betaproteobacteria bacterium]
MKLLETLARLCAILAGILLIGITLMTVYSVIGRDFFGKALTGDFEITAVMTGAAISMFLPYCQLRRGNIIVDFFTAKTSDSTRSKLDRVGAFLLAVMMGLCAWRATLGGMSAFKSNSGTMMLGFPEWIVYCFIVPGLTLTAIIALTQAIRGFSHVEGEEVLL